MPLLAFCALVAGCGHVAANYPESSAGRSGDPIDDSSLQGSCCGLQIRIGDRIDTAALRAKRATVYGPMSEAMGEASFRDMRAQARKRYPWTSMISEDDSSSYYRGTVSIPGDAVFVVSEGALVFAGVVDGNPVRIRDEGILFHLGEEQRTWRYTATGPVRLEQDPSASPPRRVVSITIRLPREFEMSEVTIDSSRIRDSGSNSSHTVPDTPN